MCGITGMICQGDDRLDERILAEMTLRLSHRGPDDAGEKIIRHADCQVGLGHRRLSIIDLSEAGHQPMTNETGSLWLTYNGEIYNYHELREDLLGRGHTFVSRTDTEVILHGYEQYGLGLFERLDGMFAFGLWDDDRRQLILARDRYGKKPLYYRPSKTGFLFASELKSLLAHPETGRRIDMRSLSRYLLYEYVPAPYSIIEGIYKVPAGHYLLWKAGQVSLCPFWQIDFGKDAGREQVAEPELARQLLELLKRSVERRLVSDVPLGVFLSGGIDSASLVAMMTELLPADRIKTFSIGFDDGSFDESPYARKVAKYFGTQHHEKVFTPAALFKTLPEVWAFLDEPFADASVLPTYLLAKFTRESVTVALGGDGGDELFAGYDPFIAHKLAAYYQAIPPMLREKALEPLFLALPVSTRNMSLDFRIKQFLKGLPHPLAVRNQVWLGSFDLEEQQALLTPDCAELLGNDDPYAEILDACRGIPLRDDLDPLIYLYCRHYLGEDILTKVDRASMAASLEVRTPYLDTAFSSFVHALPSRMKIRGLARKYLLKRALAGRMPEEILRRKKKGFGIPLAQWLKKELKPMLLDVFSPERIRRGALFNPKVVEALLQDHFSERKDNRKPLWTLLMFEMWRERFGMS